MAGTKRVCWCSCTIIDFLQGTDRAKEHCPAIVEAARRGELQIVISAMAEAEVIRIDGKP